MTEYVRDGDVLNELKMLGHVYHLTLCAQIANTPPQLVSVILP